MKNALLLIATIFMMQSPFAVAHDGHYKEERTLTLSVDGLDELEIDCGAGFLIVNGEATGNDIIVEAEIVIDTKKEAKAQELMEDYLELSLEKKGKSAILKSMFNSDNGWSLFKSWPEAKVNLTVYVPSHLALTVDDGSGHSEVYGVCGDVYFDDGSGNLLLKDIEGNIEIDDGSGNMTITNCAKSLTIDDGSGNMDITSVGGEVKIDDGSGNLNLENIEGSVKVDDGSGNINISNVRGKVSIDDGSGNIYLENIENDVHFYATGSGMTNLNNVRGEISGDIDND